jgi:hypothetical protein
MEGLLMETTLLDSSIVVAIGGQTRHYHAFVTTAPAALDVPTTLTLHHAAFSEVSHLAACSIAMDTARAKTPARLVLVEATEPSLQRVRWKEGRSFFTAADPVLVGLNELQSRLWHRLKAPLGDVERANARE